MKTLFSYRQKRPRSLRSLGLVSLLRGFFALQAKNGLIVIGLKYVFSTPAAPGRHPILSDHPTTPRPTHTAALAIPSDRTGVAAKLGERRFFRVALQETASIGYILCWLNCRALDSGQKERQLNLPVSAFSLFFMLYCCTIIVHTW